MLGARPGRADGGCASRCRRQPPPPAAAAALQCIPPPAARPGAPRDDGAPQPRPPAACRAQVLFRKGGISEPTFKPQAERFFLFPTAFHTEASLLQPGAAERYAQVTSTAGSVASRLHLALAGCGEPLDTGAGAGRLLEKKTRQPLPWPP